MSRQIHLSRQHNAMPLPMPDTLIGRSRETAEIGHLLRNDDVRILILTGLGGMGKTALSYSIGTQVADDFQDGVHFVSLATITNPDLLLPTIVQALHIPEPAASTPERNLSLFLRQKNLLLILDGFEGLATATPRVIDVLAAAPQVKALITSRVPLPDVDALEYVVPPLLPDAASTLFVERARAANPDLPLSAQNEASVADICALLDGLPLAIELAAAQCATLTPQAILDHLRQHPTQQAMHNIIAWSYATLEEAEKRLFACLAAFVGGWTADAAIQVYARDTTTVPKAADAWDRLAALVTKNLVQQDEDSDGEAHFSMLAPICEYASGRLSETGDEACVRAAHAAYYADLIEKADLTGEQQQRWRRRLETELGNIRAAFAWVVAHDDGQTALRLSGAMWRFWHNGGYLSEGRRALQQALALDGTDTARARALNGAGVLAWAQGDYADAVPLLEQSLALQQLKDDPGGVSDVKNLLGLVARAQGNYAEAYAYYQESIRLRREVGNRLGVAYSLNNLGLIARDLGDYPKAAALFDESLAMCRDLHDLSGAARAINNRGATRLMLGEMAAACADCQISVRVFVTLGDKRSMAECLEALACVFSASGDSLSAAHLSGAAATLRETIGAPMSPAERAFHKRMCQLAPHSLNPDDYRSALNEGRSLSLDKVLRVALADLPV